VVNRPSSHPLPEEGTPDPRTWSLRVDGQVTFPQLFTMDDLLRMGHVEHAGEFTCVAGWSEGDTRWEGTPLAAVLSLVQPHDSATALYSYARGYRALVPLEAARTAILATHVNGELLTMERGAPCRLIVEDETTQLSVKWIQRLELFTRRRDQEPGPRKPPS